MNEDKAIKDRNRYRLEEVFKNFDEYQDYLRKALTLFQDMQKSRELSFRNYVPEFLEIEFASVKAPRLYFPRYKGAVVVQLPEGKLSPKQKGFQRERALIQFSPIVKINELSLADEFAVRMKIMTHSDANKPKRSRKSKANSIEDST